VRSTVLDKVHMHTYHPHMMRVDSGLRSCNCFAIRRAARQITRLYERRLSAAQLTIAQFNLLVLLDESGAETMNSLSEAMLMDRTTLLRALKPLKREEMVRARSVAEDPRQLVFSLTTVGQRKLTHARKLWQDAQKEFEAKVGSDRAKRMRHDLLTLSV
jgi:DNA-binding MarR family transcriptional regulator